jgi:protein-S-isoprenylcysteine O-methyltransferase Ste14
MTNTQPDSAPSACPASATHGAVAWSGLLGLVAGVYLIRWFHPFQDIAYSALAVMACTALGVYLPDLLWQKVYRRSLSPEVRAGDWERVAVKFAGLLCTMGFITLLYWAVPEYHHSDAFYQNYWKMLGAVMPVWLVLALPYIYWVDRRMAEPRDALWQMGCLVTLRWQNLHTGMIAQHLLGWLVKGYFLPLMFSYMCGDLGRILAFDYGRIDGFKSLYDFAYLVLFFVDVGYIAMTYLLSLRLTDTHIRSTQPTLLGWTTAVICYQPFYTLISRQFLDYDSGKPWGEWLSGQPWLYDLCGTLILLLLSIYVWATIAFGGRFSNLTHRGIITNGPYRYSKHPAYLTKNLSWWLISMPFMITTTVEDALRNCLLLLMINAIYYLRAKTEERHLSLDPVYVEYAKWIDAHGLLRFINRLPLLRRLASWRPQFARPPLDWVYGAPVNAVAGENVGARVIPLNKTNRGAAKRG